MEEKETWKMKTKESSLNSNAKNSFRDILEAKLNCQMWNQRKSQNFLCLLFFFVVWLSTPDERIVLEFFFSWGWFWGLDVRIRLLHMASRLKRICLKYHCRVGLEPVSQWYFQLFFMQCALLASMLSLYSENHVKHTSFILLSVT